MSTALEDGDIEASPNRGSRLQIRGVAVTGEPDGGPEHVLPALEVALRRLEHCLVCLLPRADTLLLRLQQIERDRVRVEGLGACLAHRRAWRASW
jgi:hypothetical protein